MKTNNDLATRTLDLVAEYGASRVLAQIAKLLKHTPKRKRRRRRRLRPTAGDKRQTLTREIEP